MMLFVLVLTTDLGSPLGTYTYKYFPPLAKDVRQTCLDSLKGTTINEVQYHMYAMELSNGRTVLVESGIVEAAVA